MKKMIMIFALAVLVLVVGSKTQAGITYVEVVDASSGQPNTYFDVYRWFDSDWGWTHTFNPPEYPNVTINSATLEIYAHDVDYDEVDLIEGDGLSLGQLEGAADYTWHLSVIPLDAAAIDALLVDGSMDMWVDIGWLPSYDHGPFWGVTIASSTLTVDYDVIVPDPPDPPDPPCPPCPPIDTIPAPGAVLLGSIGISLVGWLRRRRTL